MKTYLDGSIRKARVKTFNADGTLKDDTGAFNAKLADNDIVLKEGITAEQQVKNVFVGDGDVMEKTSERSGNEINNPKKTARLTDEQKQKLGIKIEKENNKVEEEEKDEDKRVKASPAARKLASDNEINLFKITPTGKNGIITKADVQKAIDEKSDTDGDTQAKLFSKERATEATKKIKAQSKELLRNTNKFLSKIALKAITIGEEIIQRRRLRKAFSFGAGSESVLADIYLKKASDNIISVQFFNRYLTKDAINLAGQAAGTTIFLNLDNSESDTFFHENGHIFINLYGNTDEVKQMLKEVVKSPIYQDIKTGYLENIIYEGANGNKILLGNVLLILNKLNSSIPTNLDEFAKANNLSLDRNTGSFAATERLFFEFATSLAEQAGYSELDESLQTHLQEEALAELIGQYGVENPEVFTGGKKEAKKMNSLVGKLKAKIKGSFTNEELAVILEETSGGKFKANAGVAMEERLAEIAGIIQNNKAEFDLANKTRQLQKKRKTSRVQGKHNVIVKSQFEKQIKERLNEIMYGDGVKETSLMKKALAYFSNIENTTLLEEFKSLDSATKKGIFRKEQAELDFLIQKDYATIARQMLLMYEEGTNEYQQIVEIFSEQSTYNSIKKQLQHVYLKGLTIQEQKELNEFTKDKKNIKATDSFISALFGDNLNLEEENQSLDDAFQAILDDSNEKLNDKINVLINGFLRYQYLVNDSSMEEYSKTKLLQEINTVIKKSGNDVSVFEEIMYESDSNTVLGSFAQYVREVGFTGSEITNLHHELSSFHDQKVMVLTKNGVKILLNKNQEFELSKFLKEQEFSNSKLIRKLKGQLSYTLSNYFRARNNEDKFNEGTFKTLSKSVVQELDEVERRIIINQKLVDLYENYDEIAIDEESLVSYLLEAFMPNSKTNVESLKGKKFFDVNTGVPIDVKTFMSKEVLGNLIQKSIAPSFDKSLKIQNFKGQVLRNMMAETGSTEEKAKKMFIKQFILADIDSLSLETMNLLMSSEDSAHSIITAKNNNASFLVRNNNPINNFIQSLARSVMFASDGDTIGELASTFDGEGKPKLYNTYQKKNNMIRNIEDLKALKNNPDGQEMFDNLFGNNIYKDLIDDIADEGLLLLIGDEAMRRSAEDLDNNKVGAIDINIILDAITTGKKNYIQVIFDHADKKKRYYTSNAITLTKEQAVERLAAIRENEINKVSKLINQHNNTDFNIYNFVTEKTAKRLEQETGLTIDNLKKPTKGLKKDVYGLLGSKLFESKYGFWTNEQAFKKQAEDFVLTEREEINKGLAKVKQDFSEKKYTEKQYKALVNRAAIAVAKLEKKKTLYSVALMNYAVNKYYLQDLFKQSYDEINFTQKNKRAAMFSAPHVATLNQSRLEVVGFADENIDGFAVVDSGSYVTEATARRIEQKHGVLTGVSGSFKFVGGGQNLDNDRITEHMGERSSFYFKGHTTILTESDAMGTPLEGVYKALLAREKELGDDVLVVAYADSGIKKSKVEGLNTKTMGEWASMSEDEINDFQNNFYSGAMVHGYDASHFGIQNEIDQEGVTATSAKQADACTYALKGLDTGSDVINKEVNDLVDESLAQRQLALDGQFKKHIEGKPVSEITQSMINEGISKPEIVWANENGYTDSPSFFYEKSKNFAAAYRKFVYKLRTSGTQALQVSDLTRGYEIGSVNDVVTTNQRLRSIGQELYADGKNYKPAQCIISRKMADKLGLKIGDEVLATRIPASLPSSRVVLVVTQLTDNNDNTIAVHPEVSDILGSDLDGDMLHINAKRSESDKKYDENIDKHINNFINTEVSLYTKKEVVDGILKQSVEFKELAKETKEALNITDEEVLNDFMLTDTTKMYEQTKGNQPMIAIVCSYNTSMNYFGVDNPILYCKNKNSKEPSLPITIESNGKSYTKLDGKISNKELGALINHGVWANLILDDGKNGNRARFGFNKDTALSFIIMLRMGIDPVTISKVMTNKNVVEALDGKKSMPSEEIDVTINIDSLLDGDKFEASNFVSMMHYMKKDVRNIMRLADMTKVIKSDSIDVLETLLDFESSLKNQPGLSEVIKNNKHLSRNKEYWKEYINISLKENPQYSNDYIDSVFPMDEDYNPLIKKSSLAYNILTEKNSGITMNVMKDLLLKRVLINREKSNSNDWNVIDSIQKGVSLIYTAEGEVDKNYIYNTEGELLTLSEQSQLLNNAAKVVFKGLVGKFSHLVLSQEINTSNETLFWKKQIISLNNNAISEIQDAKVIEMIGDAFESLSIEEQDFLIAYDLIQNGWGLTGTNQSMIKFMGNRANSIVNDMFARVQDESISNFDKDINAKIGGKNSVDVILGSEGLNSITKSQIQSSLKKDIDVSNRDVELANERTLAAYYHVLNNYNNSNIIKFLDNKNDIYVEFYEKGKLLNEENYYFADQIKLVDNQFGLNREVVMDVATMDSRKVDAYSKIADTTNNQKDQSQVSLFKKVRGKSDYRTNIKGIGETLSKEEFIENSGVLYQYGVDSIDEFDTENDAGVLKLIDDEYNKYQEDVEVVKDIYNDMTYSYTTDTEGKKSRLRKIENVKLDMYDNADSDNKFKGIEKEFINAQNELKSENVNQLAAAPLQSYLEYHFGRHMAQKQIADWEKSTGQNFEDIMDKALNKDISSLELWFSPGDFGASKPTAAYVNRMLREEHSKHTQHMNDVTKEMNKALDSLFAEKYKNGVQRNIYKFLMKFFSSTDYAFSKVLFGNIMEEVSYLQETESTKGKSYKYQTEVRLKQDLFNGEIKEDQYGDYFSATDLKSDEELSNTYGLSDAEINYLKMYTTYTGFYSEMIEAKKLYAGRKGANYVPAVKSGVFETYSRRGLFGMYYRMKKGGDNFSNIHIKGVNPLTGESEILKYDSWKQIFMSAPGDIMEKYRYERGTLIQNNDEFIGSITAKERIAMFMEINKKAKKLYKTGKDDLGAKIEIESDLNEATDLDNAKSINRFLSKRSGRAAYLGSMNLHKGLRQYSNRMSFLHGNSFESNGQTKALAWNNSTSKFENVTEPNKKVNVFRGFEEKKAHIDAATAFLAGDKFFKTGNVKAIRNPKTIKFLDQVLKGKFIEGREGGLLSGFQTEKKAVQFFTNWTMYVALGFNVPAAIGNVAIGKYNTYRQKGGKKAIKGEMRYFGVGVDGVFSLPTIRKSRALIKEFGILTYRAEEIAEGVGGSSISSLVFWPMITAENWIQQAAFLGSMTDEQWNAYDIDSEGNLIVVDENNAVTEEEKLRLEREVTDVQGRGYSEVDQRYVQSFVLGNMAMQFKRWFPTFIADRFKSEYVNDLGSMNIGTIRAAAEFYQEQFSQGNYPFSEGWKESYDKLPKFRQEAIIKFWRGTYGAATIALLLGLLKGFTDDDDEKDNEAITFVEKLLGDVLLLGNVPRLTFMAQIPAVKTFENLSLATYNLAIGSEYKRKGKYGKKGDKRYKSYLAQLMPKPVREPLLGVGTKKKRKIR